MGKYAEKFKEWITKSDEHKKIARLWFRHYRIKRSIEFMEQYDADALWKRLETAIRNRKRKHCFVYASSVVAASLLLILTFTYIKPDETIVQEGYTDAISGVYTFSEKGGKKAILTLHSGEEIDLVSRVDPFIANGNDTLLLIQPDKSLVYSRNENNKEDTGRYNMLSVPRGGEYKLVLSDGTNVWLNAESSLYYPVSFSQTREVKLMGEAYFEVTTHHSPFIIQVGVNHKVEVLGTKFNVSAYTGDVAYTTLAEGKVTVHNANTSVTLSPNQQAIATETGSIAIENVDATLYTSWAQGVFRFRKARLSEIAAQLSRWYDVDISFSDEQLKQKLFSGVILRHRELEFAVETIEKISNVTFITGNNTIYITNRKKKNK